jgi:hypothetical protein
MKLFSEQQDNIRSAMPRGLSLADFDTTASSPRRAEEHRGGVHRHEEPASGFPSWLPLLLLPLIGLVGWWLWPKPAPAPKQVVVQETREVRGPIEVDRTAVIEREGKKVEGVVEEVIKLAPGMEEALKVGTDLTGLFGNLSKVLGGVKDEETARAAIPTLNGYAPMLEAIQKSTAALPDAGKTSIVEMVTKNIGSLQGVIDTVMAIPGVKEILGPVVAPMIETITKLGK